MTSPPVILDGGLATELERRGHDLTGVLWSAAVLREDPSAIRDVHAAFFAAGATVATTATYQLSGMSLRAAGFDPSELGPLVERAVAVAVEARDATCPDGLVAASVGPYGASRADGSEYTGNYGLGERSAAIRVLRDFHRPRLEALLSAEVDLLACETLPSAVEVEALVAEIDSLGAAIPVWFSLTPAPGGRTTRQGEPLADVAELLAGLDHVVALGVNCCPPADVVSALTELHRTKPGCRAIAGIAYPNSGETWDAVARAWHGTPGFAPGLAQGWAASGARYIGGCCRVTPEQIRVLADYPWPGV